MKHPVERVEGRGITHKQPHSMNGKLPVIAPCTQCRDKKKTETQALTITAHIVHIMTAGNYTCKEDTSIKKRPGHKKRPISHSPKMDTKTTYTTNEKSSKNVKEEKLFHKQGKNTIVSTLTTSAISNYCSKLGKNENKLGEGLVSVDKIAPRLLRTESEQGRLRVKVHQKIHV